MTISKTIGFSLLVTLFVGCATHRGSVDTTRTTSSSTQNSTVAPPTLSDIDEAVTKNNEIRAKLYSGSSIAWSAKVASTAQAHANSLANSGLFAHDTSTPYGENIFMASYPVGYTDAVNNWYEEHIHYNHIMMNCDSGQVCGHYTQLIWQATTEFGCGKATYKRGEHKGWTIIVCQYNPPGNYIGQKPY